MQMELTVCPWNVFMGRSWPSLHTWMHMSVLHEANVLLLCQSTSRAGAEREKEKEKICAYKTLFAPQAILAQVQPLAQKLLHITVTSRPASSVEIALL